VCAVAGGYVTDVVVVGVGGGVGYGAIVYRCVVAVGGVGVSVVRVVVGSCGDGCYCGVGGIFHAGGGGDGIVVGGGVVYGVVACDVVVVGGVVIVGFGVCVGIVVVRVVIVVGVGIGVDVVVVCCCDCVGVAVGIVDSVDGGVSAVFIFLYVLV